MRIIKNICCIGAGYVGGPTMTVIASQLLDKTVLKQQGFKVYTIGES
jgi:hypothetical protein